MSALAKTTDAHFSASQIATIKSVLAPGISDAELTLFSHVCERTGLDPFAKQIYAIMRNVKDGDRWVKKMTIQTGIDGYRLIAERTGKYQGQAAFEWCGPDGQWKDVWTSTTMPVAARASVYRSGFVQPLVRVARWQAYVQTNKDHKVTGQWVNMGPEQLAKCAEALALRTAFPQELSGLYTKEEMEQADNEHVVSAPPVASIAVRSEPVLPPPTAAEKPLVFVWETHPLEGKPVVGQPAVVLTAYLQHLDRVIADPAKADWRARVEAHKTRVEAVYESLLKSERDAKLDKELQKLGQAPAKMADESMGVDRMHDEGPESWGLAEPPADVVLPTE